MMGASHSVSWDASVGRDASEGPLLVITAEALKQLTSQIKEQHEAKVRIRLSVVSHANRIICSSRRKRLPMHQLPTFRASR